MENIHSSVLKN